MPIGNHRQDGFGYVGLMVAVVLFGLGAVGAARILASTDRGEREAELLFIGGQFRSAIRTYYESGPVVGQFPPTLDDLLLDRRVPTPRRHLRRIYTDPLTGKTQWGLVRSPQGTIMGIYSLSERVPMKRDNFEAEDADLSQAVMPSKQASAAALSTGNLTPLVSTVKLAPINANSYSYQDWRFIYHPANAPLKTARPAESGGG